MAGFGCPPRQALGSCRLALRFTHQNGSAWSLKGAIELALQEYDAALASARRAVVTSHQHPATLSLIACVYAARNEPEKAERALTSLRNLTPDSSTVNGFYLAEGECALNRHDEALNLLEAAADIHAPELLEAAVTPLLDSLHGRPRFENLLKRIGITKNSAPRPVESEPGD
jgi:tetratricopeptide (TPR) repeat protein